MQAGRDCQDTARTKREMKSVEVLYMNGGDGETSYANNSFLQKKVIESVKPIRDQAITDLCNSSTFPSCLSIADFGCSSGPNALLVVSEFITTAHNIYKKHGHQSPEFQIYLNDLPMNDFNTLFKSLENFNENLDEQNGSDLGPCFIAGVPGSFYGRLLPSRSLSFAYSSYSLMWLSQVPEWVAKNNGRNIYMGKDSPPSVVKARYEQFKSDFSLFLKSRSEELAIGGRMVFTIIGRESDNPVSKESGCYFWEIINDALNDMVSEGLIEEEKLVSFNVPSYLPSVTEVKIEVSEEGSFTIDKLEVSTTKWSICKSQNPLKSASINFSEIVRAALDPLLSDHFGSALANEAFLRYQKTFVDRMEIEDPGFVNITLSMIKKI